MFGASIVENMVIYNKIDISKVSGFSDYKAEGKPRLFQGVIQMMWQELPLDQ